MLDHGTGIVIGETAVVGDNCSILQNVTLGGTGKETGDRHPKIGDNVLLSVGAKVLGNIRVGDCSRVGAGSVVLKEVPPAHHGCRRAGQGRSAPPAALSRPAPWINASHPTIAAAARRDPVEARELVKVQTYLRKVFGAKTLSVRARPKIKDSAEVYIGDEFIGTLTREDEDGELCYQFQMAILEMDLEDA